MKSIVIKIILFFILLSVLFSVYKFHNLAFYKNNGITDEYCNNKVVAGNWMEVVGKDDKPANIEKNFNREMQGSIIDKFAADRQSILSILDDLPIIIDEPTIISKFGPPTSTYKHNVFLMYRWVTTTSNEQFEISLSTYKGCIGDMSVFSFDKTTKAQLFYKKNNKLPKTP